MSTQQLQPKPPLPTPRTLLTTLLNAISTIPLLPAPNTTHPSKPTTNPSPDNDNPLRRVPSSHRHLITTLHVLFPGLLLPALDLLERGLVARVGLLSPNSNSSSTNTGPEPGPEHDYGSSTDANHRPSANREREGQVRKTAFYLVTSASAAAAAAEKRRRGRGGGGDGETEEEGSGVGGTGGYVVRLGAWQCSCAAFAFAAAVQGEVGEGGMMVCSTREEAVRAEAGWSFGGVSLDGLRAGEGVPVCKHLMACLLAERWSAALGRYVVERRVGREEMAGIVADV